MTNGMSIKAFIKTANENISKSSFLCYYDKSSLANYKKQGVFDANIAKLFLQNILKKPSRVAKKELRQPQNTHYLTGNEEHFC